MTEGRDDFDDVVTTLANQARADPQAWARDGWHRAATAVADRAVPFVAWARAHRRWCFVVAEAAEAVCAKPPEAATFILHAIVDEIIEDDLD
jgi:hypothetical protein